jgi:hypothetical protein
MTSTEVERLIREKLERDQLLQFLDEHKSQFLEFPDGLFVELVLNDGSKLIDVERICREMRESLQKQGIDLDVIVRADWTVRAVASPGPARAESGGIRAVWGFPAKLVSGKAVIDVEVDVTQLAVQEIKRRVADGSLGSRDEKMVMRDVVTEFLKLQLSPGGESYWDPLRFPVQELNDSALHYLWMHGSVGKG